MPDATSNFTRTCFGCGRQARSGRSHACRLRLLSRLRWRGYLDGWHAAHRWAVENPDDPLVLADAADYGSGWAAFMRPGGGSVEVAS